jgi:hypothetical protein
MNVTMCKAHTATPIWRIKPRRLHHTALHNHQKKIMLLRDLADETPFKLAMGNMEIITVVDIGEDEDILIVFFNKPGDPDGSIRVMGFTIDTEISTGNISSLN